MINSLRASRSNLQADVVIGKNSYGSDVTVHVTIKPTEPGLAAILAQLDGYLVARAGEMVQAAVDEAAVQRRVTELVAARITSERVRYQANAGVKMARLAEQVERVLKWNLTDGGGLSQNDVERLRAAVGQYTADAEVEIAKAG